ncbi:MAG: myo-inositol-1-phosphate synthase [Pseudohongiellaceae bacterium]|jgi:myo-inositol-1-phosphate synthase
MSLEPCVSDRVGVWMVGALGGIGTTLVVGARAIARGLVSDTGLVTNRPEFASLGLASLDQLVFGGHDVRISNYWASAYQIYKLSGSFDLEVLQELRSELDEISKNVRSGTIVNGGEAIESLLTDEAAGTAEPLADTITRLRRDLSEFRQAHDLQRVVVVNLASTEPDLAGGAQPLTSMTELDAVIKADDRTSVRPSMLYSYAAFEEGCGYINFTPSMAALCAPLANLAQDRGLPYMGNDGKTGETLVKSALAPMFKHRNLQVLSWQGYNMLGDRDGEVLSNSENLASKVRSKDSVLQGILGYPLHTHVGIDYVKSLDDLKTAWDFIHFSGFLDHKMSMQFVWQGCDAILAAPLVLDMVRFTDLALRDGHGGPMEHLSCYFKSPIGVQQHDLHEQYQSLMQFVAQRVAEPGT